MRRIYTREAPRKRGFANGGIEGGGRLYVVLCAVLVLLVGTQARAAALSNEVHRAPGPPVVVQDDSFTFPTTPVGQTSTECRGVCFCNASNCMCENSGTIAIDKDLASPFSAYEYSLQDWTTPANCDGGTPVQPPVFVPSGQRLNFKVSFSPTRPGTFNDTLTLDSYNLDVSGSTPSGSPNLVPYQPPGWSNSLVVSTTPGTQQDSSTITSSDTLYASWAVLNNGNLPTSVTFYSDLYLDGSFSQRWQSQPPVNPGDYRFIKDYAFGPLAPGTHTLELVPDETATVGPSDNYTRTFTVVASGAPVLVPYQPSGWSGPLVVSTTPGTQTDSQNLTSSEPLYLSWSIQNQGDLSTFGTFFVDVDLDGSLLNRWTWSNPVAPQDFADFKDYQFGPLAAGTHTLELIPDPTDVIGASSSTYTKTITVSQPGPPPPPPMPVTSTSWYVEANTPYPPYKTGTDSALYAWAYSKGKEAGQTNLAPANAMPFVILSFGHPYQFSNGAYGATGYGRKLTMAEIENTAMQFIMGYEAVANCCLTLAVGVTNEEVGSAARPYVTPAHASAWAQMVVDLEEWSVSQGFPGLFVGSACDAEVGYNSPQATQAWFLALASGLQGHAIINYDFGDAAGCAGTSGIKPQTCQKIPYKWTQADVANLLAVDIAQVYDNGQALDWQAVSLYQVRHGEPFLVRGALTQQGACLIRGKQQCINKGTYNAPQDAWKDIVTALTAKMGTRPGLAYLAWSSDITWSYK